MRWTYKETVRDWLNYVDESLIYNKNRGELWDKSKTITLDSILAFDYIRRRTDNLPLSNDNRIQALIDLCLLSCRDDYFERFLRYRSEIYHNQESRWWIDCWETIRLNNILHELGIRDITEYFKNSEGKWFKEKWGTFFQHASSNKIERNSLPAFSFLEGIRFLVNLQKPIPLEELQSFLTRLCNKSGQKFELFPRSNEIRAKSIGLINYITQKCPKEYDLSTLYSNIRDDLKFLLRSCEWDQYSHTGASIILETEDEEIIDIIRQKIPKEGSIDNKWLTGNNYHRKPRFGLLALFHNINEHVRYFELVEPNRFTYSPTVYVNSYVYVGQKIDNILQEFSEIRDIQKKVQNNDIREDYFKDLVKLGIKTLSGKDEYVKWTEKERMTSTGRTTDIYVIVKSGVDIPVEVKLLWRFRDGYEPITENIEQITEGTHGIIIVINPPDNPTYLGKYQGFEGWKAFVQDHETYIPGTMREDEDRFYSPDKLKTPHIFSDHHHILREREKNITLLSFFVDLQNFVRSQYLSRL
jgi:hypothetical protein